MQYQCSAQDLERFWAKIVCDLATGCWLWTGSIMSAGYGSFGISRRTVLAHRFSYTVAFGALPLGLVVRHDCDTYLCVRPEHMRLGTQKENVLDWLARGRGQRPTIPKRLRQTAEQRFWGKVHKTTTCWLWKGATISRMGYGSFRSSGKTVTAHRYSWQLAHGSIPVGLHILHKCDVPACVRPDHLRLGTHIENIADKVAKGRQAHGKDFRKTLPLGDRNGSRLYPERRPRGDNHWTRLQPDHVLRGEANKAAKLTASTVTEIRTLHSAGYNAVALGRQFGISNVMVSRIVRRKAWTHVP